jgi:hypothetical protein
MEGLGRWRGMGDGGAWEFGRWRDYYPITP